MKTTKALRKQEENVTSVMRVKPFTYGKLGRRVELKMNTTVSINEPGFGIDMHVESVSLHFGIGKDHTAYLVMPKLAWEALKAGEKLDITTLNKFKKQFL